MEQKQQRQCIPPADVQPLLPSHEAQRQPSGKLLQRISTKKQLLQQTAPTDDTLVLGHQSSSKSTISLLLAASMLGLIYRLVSSSGSSSPASYTGSSSSHLLRLHSHSIAGSGATFDNLPSSDVSRLDSDDSSSSSNDGGLSVPCAYGSLPGTWVSTAPIGERWQILDPECPLTNWLAAYIAAGQNSSSSDAAESSYVNRSISSSHIGSGDAVEGGNDSDSYEQAGNVQQQQQQPMVHMLLLSDSVDRFLVEHVCGILGGTKETHMMPPTPDAEEAEKAAEEALRNFEATQQQQQQQQQTPPAPAAVGLPSGQTLLNKTAYAFHTCQAAAPIKLASSYFPGVHPTGPYHRFSAQNYKKRIDTARQMWTLYAGPGSQPEMISVASLLWDVARLYMHETGAVEGRQELDKALLDGWVRNYTAVVEYAQTVFPETKLWVTHTTMPPHHDTQSGLMTKPYLGRLYFIHQLNAAAATAAHLLDMQMVDYEAMSERFSVGQQHLIDMIHPNALVGLEVFNVMLNIVRQQQRLQERQ